MKLNLKEGIFLFEKSFFIFFFYSLIILTIFNWNKYWRTINFNAKIVEIILKKKKKNEENLKRIDIDGLVRQNQAKKKIQKIITKKVNLNQKVIKSKK